jgi:hypothetical protein
MRRRIGWRLRLRWMRCSVLISGRLSKSQEALNRRAAERRGARKPSGAGAAERRESEEAFGRRGG